MLTRSYLIWCASFLHPALKAFKGSNAYLCVSMSHTCQLEPVFTLIQSVWHYLCLPLYRYGEQKARGCLQRFFSSQNWGPGDIIVFPAIIKWAAWGPTDDVMLMMLFGLLNFCMLDACDARSDTQLRQEWWQFE